MRRAQYLLTSALGAVALATALILLIWPSDETAPGPSEPNQIHHRLQAVDSAIGNAELTTHREAQLPSILVVDSDGVGIEGASIWLNVTNGVSGALLTGEPSGATDAHGARPLPSENAGALSCVRRRGYVSKTFSVAHSAVTRVQMERSRSIVVEAMSSSGPVADCLVLLTLRESVPVTAAFETDPASEGTVEAQVPIWRSVTRPDGTCEFEAPTDAPLWLAVYHDAMYPVEHVALALEPIVASPAPSRISVTMRDMLGIAVAIPDTATFSCHVWKYESGRMSEDVGTIARYRYCKSRLEARMPGCVTLTFVPNTALPECPVQLAALDTIGREWGLDWVFVPLRTMQQPVFAHLVASPAPAVVDVRMEVQGRPIEGTPMQLGRTAKNGQSLVFPVTSGATLTVPSGTYWLDVEDPMGFGPELPEPPRVHEPEGSRVELKVSVPYEVVKLAVTPRIDNEPMDLAVAVSLSDKESSVTTFWKAGRGQLLYWVTPGEYQLTARPVGYPVTTRTIQVSTGAKSMEIVDFVLRR